MWTLVLFLYTTDVNRAEIGFVRRFTSEAACEAAAELAQKRVRRGFNLTHLCAPALNK